MMDVSLRILRVPTRPPRAPHRGRRPITTSNTRPPPATRRRRLEGEVGCDGTDMPAGPTCTPLDRSQRSPIMCGRIDPTPRWRNWQTHYFEVVAPQGVQVQVLSWASLKAIRKDRLLRFQAAVTLRVFDDFRGMEIGRAHV